MTEKRKLQVFVSSTYIDLQEERQAAVQAILMAGHIPAGMELFTAGDETQMKVIKRWIDESDVYMLILGGRYGSVEPKSQKSYTHLEYEYAAKKGKPLFAVVINQEYIEARVNRMGAVAKESENPKKLKQFRKIVCGKMVRFWNDTKDIKMSILESLEKFSSKPELVGWIPGTEAVKSAALVEQIASLTKLNAELKREKAELTKNNSTLAKENSELRERKGNTEKPEEMYNGMTFVEMYRMLSRRDLDLIEFLKEESKALAMGLDLAGGRLELVERVDSRRRECVAELAAVGLVSINRDRSDSEIAFLSETGKKLVARLQHGF